MPEAPFRCVRCHEHLFPADGVSSLGPGFSVHVFPAHRGACPALYSAPILAVRSPRPIAAVPVTVTTAPATPSPGNRKRRLLGGFKKGVRR